MGCGASSTETGVLNQNEKRANGDIHGPKAPLPSITRNSMKGDYSQFQLAKYQREKQQKERQVKLFIAADELSGKVLEERERLSLGTRSRATSRNTSRTTSPTNNKRSVQFKDETNPMTPVIEDRNRSESYRSESLPKSSIGASTAPASSKGRKKKMKSKHKKKSNKDDKTKSSKSKSKKYKSGKKSRAKTQISIESEDRDSGLEDSALNNENSDGVQSVEDELKDITDEIHSDDDENSTTGQDIEAENHTVGNENTDNENDQEEGINTNKQVDENSNDVHEKNIVAIDDLIDANRDNDTHVEPLQIPVNDFDLQHERREKAKADYGLAEADFEHSDSNNDSENTGINYDKADLSANEYATSDSGDCDASDLINSRNKALDTISERSEAVLREKTDVSEPRSETTKHAEDSIIDEKPLQDEHVIDGTEFHQHDENVQSD